MEQDEEYQRPYNGKTGKQHNVLPLWGNEQSMNLNPLILANIQGSSYFKVHLFKLKTYHEVVDEIYYQVKHLEPWEKGSRKTAGQTGMCGGVRGVGAGGIVSTAYCLLYKLYTLRLTRKQVNGLLTHSDSPYIRALGFMYIRYTQPPADLFDWYEEYLEDEEEIDIKAGGGQVTTIGSILKQWLVKLDWFSTLFPRIPVPVQNQIGNRLKQYERMHPTINKPHHDEYQNHGNEAFSNQSRGRGQGQDYRAGSSRQTERDRERSPFSYGEAERYAKDRNDRYNREKEYKADSRTPRDDYRISSSRDKYSDRDRSERSGREYDRDRHSRDRNRDRVHKSEKYRERSRSRDKKRHYK